MKNRRPAILLVDDDRDTREVFGIYFDRILGYRVFTAANGMEALALNSSVRPDVILTDARLPVMDGFTLCRTVKACPDAPAAEVIIFSAIRAEVGAPLAAQAGADAYLRKPCSLSTLAATVTNLRHAKTGLLPARQAALLPSARCGGQMADSAHLSCLKP
jgi:DNA-binding response OmpR family regulator